MRCRVFWDRVESIIEPVLFDLRLIRSWEQAAIKVRSGEEMWKRLCDGRIGLDLSPVIRLLSLFYRAPSLTQ
jgi:hypothetical protein